jgi:hypothetical protein
VVVKQTSTVLCDLKFRYVGNWAEQASFSIPLKENNESTNQQRPTLDAKHIRIPEPSLLKYCKYIKHTPASTT